MRAGSKLGAAAAADDTTTASLRLMLSYVEAECLRIGAADAAKHAALAAALVPGSEAEVFVADPPPPAASATAGCTEPVRPPAARGGRLRGSPLPASLAAMPVVERPGKRSISTTSPPDARTRSAPTTRSSV